MSYAQPGLVRTILVPAIAGSTAGLFACAALIAGNVGSLGSLLRTSENGWLPVALLASGFVVTFGSAAIGGSVMALGDADD